MSNVDAPDIDGDDVERSLVDTYARPGLDGLDDFQDEDVMLAANMANCITPVGDGSDLIGGGGEVVPHCRSRSRPVLSPPSWCCFVGWLVRWFVGSLVRWLVA